jgi:hypothetical protein
MYTCNDDETVSEENEEMKGQYSYSPCYEATLDLRQRAFENVRWIFTETN